MPTINNGSGFLKNVTANLWIPRRRPYFLLFNGVLKDKLYTLCKKEKKSKRQNSCVLTIQDSLIRLKWIN